MHTCALPVVGRGGGWGAQSIFIGTQDDIANRQNGNNKHSGILHVVYQ